MVQRLAFIAYPVKDMARARKFYEEVIGLKVEQAFGENFIEYDLGEGVTFTLGKMEGWNPSDNGSYAAFEVEDYDEAMKKLRDNGAKFEMETQDLPSCRMSIVQDTEGNKIMIHKIKN